jgi:hypothetical protein
LEGQVENEKKGRNNERNIVPEAVALEEPVVEAWARRERGGSDGRVWERREREWFLESPHIWEKKKKPDSIGEEKKNLENPNPRFSSKREMQIFADKDRSQKPHWYVV